MKTIGVFLGFVAGVSAADDLGLVMPGSSQAAVDTVQNIVADVAGDSAFGGAGGGSDRAFLDNAIAEAKAHAIEVGLSEAQAGAMQGSANLAAKIALRKQTFIGGCARDFSGCPTDGNWEEQNGECVNVSGVGYCASISASASAAQKEDFAWRCSANFSCSGAGGCSSIDYSSCPQGWTRGSDGLCVASSGYNGICSPAVSFSGFSSEAKAQWAAMCGAQFPCSRGASFLAQKSKGWSSPMKFPEELYSDVNRSPIPHVNVIFDSEES
jgi:CPW-WPC domain-containing protein